MIRKKKGNLLDADVEALVNTVNTVGVMGRGVALQFKRAFPENYKAYRKVCEKDQLKTGQVFTFDLNRFQNPKYIINFPTKRHWRGKSRLEFIESGLEALVKEIRRLGIRSIALPPLGSGLGGLTWLAVYKRIEAALGDLDDVEVLVYEPHGAPEASRMLDRRRRPKMTVGQATLLGLMKAYLSALMDDSITLLEIHKLMYFMQGAGQRLRLNYVKGTYGPYATNLHHVLERIEGHFIVGYGEGTETPGKVINYKPEAIQSAESLLDRHRATKARFKRIEELIKGFETPYGMELLSSVDWVATRENPEACSDPNAAVEGVHSWSARKRKMFNSRHIEFAWQRLNEQGWLPRTEG